MSGLPYDGLLEKLPTDADKARNYPELLALWKSQQRAFLGQDRQTEAEFWEWDQNVQKLLSPAERAFFLEPHIKSGPSNDLQIVEVNRVNHLTKILIYRQGIRTSNGFNG